MHYIPRHIRFLYLNVELPSVWGSGTHPREVLRPIVVSLHHIGFFAASPTVTVTHFISNQRIPLPILLDTLRQMPALRSFTLERCVLDWDATDAPWHVQIPMQNLTYLKVDVDTGSPAIFALLHRRLALPNGAKRRLRSHRSSDSYSSIL
jgi:hypothetical protein